MTGTTDRSDPQVEPDEDPRRDALRCIECEFRTDDCPGGWYELTEHRDRTGHRYEHVRPARQPLTPAGIPAGQGPASLFTGPGPVRFETAPDNRELMYRREDGSIEILDWPPAGLSREAGAALWDLIATNVPAITEEGS